MDSSRIAELLKSYIVGLDLPPGIYDQLGAYLALLLRWNARTNLTAIRDPEQIVARHFGESLFAAGVLFGAAPLMPADAPSMPGLGLGGNEGSAFGLSSRVAPKGSRGEVEGASTSNNRQLTTDHSPTTLADLGSGAGFPGVPIKLAFPQLHVTLIESQNKKATFLKEVVRALRLDDIEVYNGRAEQWNRTADIVSMRAAERFETVLPVAAELVAPGGRLCLLIGEPKSGKLRDFSAEFEWQVGKLMPHTAISEVLVGIKSR